MLFESGEDLTFRSFQAPEDLPSSVGYHDIGNIDRSHGASAQASWNAFDAFSLGSAMAHPAPGLSHFPSAPENIPDHVRDLLDGLRGDGGTTDGGITLMSVNEGPRIIVTYTYKSDFGYDYSEEGYGYTDHPMLYPDGGGGGGYVTDGTPGDDLEHTDTCSSVAGAADQIRDKILSTDTDGSTLTRSWQDVEYAAFIVSLPTGGFGASNRMIYTDGYSQEVFLSDNVPVDTSSIYGIVHNHPGGGTYDLSLTRFAAYPSVGDWESADALVANGVPASQFSLWVIDPLGSLREFRYEDKADYLALTEDQKKQGENLPGASTVNGCSPE